MIACLWPKYTTGRNINYWPLVIVFNQHSYHTQILNNIASSFLFFATINTVRAEWFFLEEGDILDALTKRLLKVRYTKEKKN